jgi:hypothetical protein
VPARFGEVGARAAARLLTSNDRLQRVDLHDCKLGCVGMAEVSKSLISAAAGVLQSVALAFSLKEDDSKAGAPALTSALAATLASAMCPLNLNLTTNCLGSILEVEQFGKIATRCGAPLCRLTRRAKAVGSHVQHERAVGSCRVPTASLPPSLPHVWLTDACLTGTRA